MSLSQHDTSAVAIILITELSLLFHRKTNSSIAVLTLFCLGKASFAGHLVHSVPDYSHSKWDRTVWIVSFWMDTDSSFALHCMGFSFSNMSFQLEVLSNTYYSTDVWYYIHWKFHMGAFSQKKKCINYLQFGLLSFVEQNATHLVVQKVSDLILWYSVLHLLVTT